MKQSTFNAKLKKALIKYLNAWHSRKQICSVGKLDLYTNVKSIFGFEKYLNHLSFLYRKDITRLRISSHKLNIEIDRYARVDRADRLCSKCSLGVLGDEKHFLFECPAFNTSRESFIGLASDICKNFGGLSNPNKYFWLLNCEDEKIMKSLANCSFEVRQVNLSSSIDSCSMLLNINCYILSSHLLIGNYEEIQHQCQHHTSHWKSVWQGPECSPVQWQYRRMVQNYSRNSTRVSTLTNPL